MSERCAALLEELALEPVQPRFLTRGVGPLERRDQSGTAVQLALIATRSLPVRGGVRQGRVYPPPRTILSQPVDEPRPPLKERLMHEFDSLIVGDEQPALDECREHAF